MAVAHPAQTRACMISPARPRDRLRHQRPWLARGRSGCAPGRWAPLRGPHAATTSSAATSTGPGRMCWLAGTGRGPTETPVRYQTDARSAYESHFPKSISSVVLRVWDPVPDRPACTQTGALATSPHTRLGTLIHSSKVVGAPHGTRMTSRPAPLPTPTMPARATATTSTPATFNTGAGSGI